MNENELRNLYTLKGKIITRLELLQNDLQTVNAKISEILTSEKNAISKKEPEKTEVKR